MTGRFNPIHHAGMKAPTSSRVPANRDSKSQQTQRVAKPFHQVLQNQLFKTSHHAEVRMQQRGIQLKGEQLSKMNDAIDKAASRGGSESLILMNGTAFIVNVKNRTIVTAMEPSSLQNHVITQIDSAIIVQ